MEQSQVLVQGGYDKCQKYAKWTQGTTDLIKKSTLKDMCGDGWTPHSVTKYQGNVYPNTSVADVSLNDIVCMKALGSSTWEDDLCSTVHAKRIYFTTTDDKTFFDNSFTNLLIHEGIYVAIHFENY